MFRRVALLTAVVLICNIGALRGQTLDTRTAAHLLEQSSFGPRAADVSLVISSGYDQWLNNQFALPESPMPDDPDVDDIRNQLFLNMANGEDQLRQRMIFALSQVFVVSANKNNSGNELAPWVRLLSRNAFGNFRTLLREVSISPTMGKYLDMAYSRCTRHAATCPNGSTTTVPNENYAREMLQLFSIGLWELNQNGTVRLDGNGQPLPTYTQATLVEYARALTGWTFSRLNNQDNYLADMVPSMTGGTTPAPRYHDLGPKTLLSGVVLPASTNTTAALQADFDGVIDSVMAHPNVAPFISSRLIRSLVTSNPSTGYIHRVAIAFSTSGGDLRATLTAILTDPEARAFTITDGRLKDPILNIIGLARALGITVASPGNVSYVFSNLSQRVLTPTTVFSFYNLLGALPGHNDLFGPEFGIYPPALAIQRANFIYGILDGWWDSSTFPFNATLATYSALADDANALVATVNQNLMFGRMTSDLRDLIVAATNAIPIGSDWDRRQRAFGALYLAAISSEYSVYSDTSVSSAASVQPPTGLSITRMVGNTITVGWRSPLTGPAPTGYVLEGGVRPGEVLASIPIGSTVPSFTFAAPPGSFYIRMRTVSNGVLSRPSSEVRLYVNATAGPTAPASLSGYGSGASVVLRWRNTFGGGEPHAVALDVSQNGARVLTIPLPVTETFSHNAVPPGTYSFTVRATNAAGTSGASNSVTMTFPLSGCSAPGTPTSYSTAVTGRTVSVYWLPATSGTAPTGYLVEARLRNANNSTTPLGIFPVSGQSISSPVGPGRYEIRVRAENICGRSGNTGWQTVNVQ